MWNSIWILCSPSYHRHVTNFVINAINIKQKRNCTSSEAQFCKNLVPLTHSHPSSLNILPYIKGSESPVLSDLHWNLICWSLYYYYYYYYYYFPPPCWRVFTVLYHLGVTDVFLNFLKYVQKCIWMCLQLSTIKLHIKKPLNAGIIHFYFLFAVRMSQMICFIMTILTRKLHPYTLPQLSKCVEREVHYHISVDSHLLDQPYQDLYKESVWNIRLCWFWSFMWGTLFQGCVALGNWSRHLMHERCATCKVLFDEMCKCM